MIEVVLLAIALAMDAFAVAIGLGAKYKNRVSRIYCDWLFMQHYILESRRA